MISVLTGVNAIRNDAATKIKDIIEKHNSKFDHLKIQ